MGQRDRPFAWRSTGAAELLGVRFKPGSLSAFTAIPISRLLNRLVRAGEVLKVSIPELEDRMYQEVSDERRISLVDHLLLDQLHHVGDPSPLIISAMDLIRRQPDVTSIQVICHQTGLYYKKLERIFDTAVGYTPKQYCRLIRFNKAIRQMNRRKTLTRIGYDCGYYDQSHFIRDFHRYVGVSPRHFRPGENTIADLLIRHQPV